jgi:hypothetical protein
MSDIVNDYFKKFYPGDWRSADYRFTSMFGGMYEYTNRKVNTVFPRITCASGLSFSAQGHYGTYSNPRSDFAEHYSEVEIGFPSARIEEFMPYIDGGEDSDPIQSVYAYVPVEIVAKVISDNGGIKEGKKE